MIDFLSQSQKESSWKLQRTADGMREFGFFVWLVVKLSGGAIRNHQDALRFLVAVFIIFSLVSVYLLYRSQQSHVYDYIPGYLQKK